MSDELDPAALPSVAGFASAASVLAGEVDAPPHGPSAEPLVRAVMPAHGTRPIKGQSGGLCIGKDPGWRILGLCEIGNFGALRRHLGRVAADRLAGEIAARIVGLHAGARIASAARGLVEFALQTNQADAGGLNLLLDACRQPVEVEGQQVEIQIHVGAATVPAAECDDIRLIEAAESALDQARRDGLIVLRDLSQPDFALDKLTLMRELPRAIAEGEMFLQYQPKVHVRRQEVASAEALIRWQHPQRGLILPGDFIAVAEDAGEIGALTLWTLRQVLDDQRRLAASGHDLRLFLNISGMLLADAAFVREACEIVTASGAKLGFEITETAVIRDPDSAIGHLQTFADIGVELAIDDYGAGLSSLAYLKRLPARELKIDKMFVMQLTSSNRDPLIVRSTIDLAHALEMEVTAEGVETPSALALLSVMGCDMVQGFLISRPLDFDAFVGYLAHGSHLASTGKPHSSFARPESFWKRA